MSHIFRRDNHIPPGSTEMIQGDHPMEETKSLLNAFERQKPLQGSFIILESKQSLLCFLSINRSRFSLKQRLFYLRNVLEQAWPRARRSRTLLTVRCKRFTLPSVKKTKFKVRSSSKIISKHKWRPIPLHHFNNLLFPQNNCNQYSSVELVGHKAKMEIWIRIHWSSQCYKLEERKVLVRNHKKTQECMLTVQLSDDVTVVN